MHGYRKQPSDLETAPQNRFHKNPQGFDVDPGDEGFAEVHFQPSNKWTLHKKCRDIKLP